MLSLPEAMLLFALRDDEGSIHSAAFLVLDDALRTAVLGELMLRGLIRVNGEGRIRWGEAADTDSPLLLAAFKVLMSAPEGGDVDTWMDVLAEGMPDLRKRIVDSLVARGAVSRDVEDRDLLADTERLPTADPTWESKATQDVRLAVACGSDIPRRMGILVGLIHVCDLWRVFGDAHLSSQGQGLGEWVLNRDPLCRAARARVSRTQGTHGELL